MLIILLYIRQRSHSSRTLQVRRLAWQGSSRSLFVATNIACPHMSSCCGRQCPWASMAKPTAHHLSQLPFSSLHVVQAGSSCK